MQTLLVWNRELLRGRFQIDKRQEDSGQRHQSPFQFGGE